uniref:Uncharacterized protein n=1 Tax=Oryza nivara TaxID=4536 RepID=A0A0E0I261_ORYNI
MEWSGAEATWCEEASALATEAAAARAGARGRRGEVAEVGATWLKRSAMVEVGATRHGRPQQRTARRMWERPTAVVDWRRIARRRWSLVPRHIRKAAGCSLRAVTKVDLADGLSGGEAAAVEDEGDDDATGGSLTRDGLPPQDGQTGRVDGLVWGELIHSSLSRKSQSHPFPLQPNHVDRVEALEGRDSTLMAD